MAQNTIIADEAITAAIMNERGQGWDSSFPSTWPANGWFFRIDLLQLYQNTGTEGTPVWTIRLDAANIGLAFTL